MDGSMACLPSCTNGFGPNYTCVQGAIFACAYAPPSGCADCGCSPRQKCVPGTGCAPKSDLGGDCKTNDDCLSANCSSDYGVCRAAFGSACSAANCDFCYASGTFSYCTGACTSDSDCNGGYCLGFAPNYMCYPPCSARCLKGCRQTSALDGSDPITYCDLENYPLIYGSPPPGRSGDGGVANDAGAAGDSSAADDAATANDASVAGDSSAAGDGAVASDTGVTGDDGALGDGG
jgi:hypothetical protein